jgi:hypothetical protein
MIGDLQLVTALLSVLADSQGTYTYGCGVEKLNVDPFNSSSPLTPVRFENFIEWYRSSSFALAYTGYNNTYALPPLNQTAGLGWHDSTLLPVALISSPFLQCINETIIASLPILDQANSPLSTGELAGIIIGFAVAIILSCLCSPPGRRILLAQKKAFQERRSKRNRKMALPSSNQDTSAKEVPADLDEKAQLPKKQLLLSSPDASTSLPDSTIPGRLASEGGRRR